MLNKRKRRRQTSRLVRGRYVIIKDKRLNEEEEGEKKNRNYSVIIIIIIITNSLPDNEFPSVLGSRDFEESFGRSSSINNNP